MKNVILLGGGKSIAEGIEKNLWEKIKGKEIWSLNFAFLTMPYLPTRQVWVDYNIFKDHAIELKKLKDRGVILIAKSRPKYDILKTGITQYHETRKIEEYYGQNALEKKILFTGKMGLVGIFALSLAVAEKYDNIVLLGYDFGTCSLDDKYTHYYQKYLNVKSEGMGHPEVYNPRGKLIDLTLKSFGIYQKEPNIKITNVSLVSKIECFEKISYDTFFDRIEKGEI